MKIQIGIDKICMCTKNGPLGNKHGKVLYMNKSLSIYILFQMWAQNIKEIRFEYEIRKSKDGNVLRFLRIFYIYVYLYQNVFRYDLNVCKMKEKLLAGKVLWMKIDLVENIATTIDFENITLYLL